MSGGERSWVINSVVENWDMCNKTKINNVMFTIFLQHFPNRF